MSNPPPPMEQGLSRRTQTCRYILHDENICEYDDAPLITGGHYRYNDEGEIYLERNE